MFIVRDSCQSLIYSILQKLCCHTVASRSPFLPAEGHLTFKACHQLDAMLRWQSYSLVIGPQIRPWARNCGGIRVQKAANSQCKSSEAGNAIYDMLLRQSGTRKLGTKGQSSDAEKQQELLHCLYEPGLMYVLALEGQPRDLQGYLLKADGCQMCCKDWPSIPSGVGPHTVKAEACRAVSVPLSICGRASS